MRDKAYLESTLSEGVMFTDHPVIFRPFRDEDSVRAHISDLYQLIDFHLARLGKSLAGLSQTETTVLFSGIGQMQGRWPMICLTEVPRGRNIQDHIVTFGAYGIVVSDDWVRRNKFDRVVYAGEDSPVSLRLWRLFARLAIASLTQNPDGQLVHDTTVFQEVLGMCAFIEQREHLTEAEWRLPGATGFFGGSRSTGSRVTLPLEDVELVLVQNHADIPVIEALVADLVASRAGTHAPRVLCQPATIS